MTNHHRPTALRARRGSLSTKLLFSGALAAGLAVLAPAEASAQDAEGLGDEPLRTRIAAGAQVVPSYPGADSISIRPLFDVSRARGDEHFGFEAADESFGFAVLRFGRLSFGPALGFEGSRTADDVGAELPKVGFTVEAGGFAEYQMTDDFRLRAEVRKGLGGHKGLIANLGADFVVRDGDDWLFSIGPRMTVADDNYHDAYFSVAPEDSGPSGLPAYNAGGGIQSVGATAGYLQQLNERWGLYSYAKYDRLIGDAADSPIVRELGSRNQFSGGVALTYTFGG